MEASEVVEVLEEMRRYGIPLCVDGGWGVDALVGIQTRSHGDLDLVLATADVEQTVNVFAEMGFAITEDEWPTRLVLTDPQERSVDLHPVTFDDEGSGIHQGYEPTDKDRHDIALLEELLAKG